MVRLVLLFAFLAVVAGKMTPNEKLKTCCATLKDADKECVNKFCDFNAISQTNVSSFIYFKAIKHHLLFSSCMRAVRSENLHDDA